MTDLNGARVLVLGATGGLGAPITRRLVAGGARVWLSSRSTDRLDELAAELTAGHGDGGDDGPVLGTTAAVLAERLMAGMAAYSATKAGLSAFGAAAGAELRRRTVRLVDVRPPHTKTGLADRPIAGTAPRLKLGLSPDAVAERIVRAIVDDERVLGADAFTAG